MNKAVQFRLAKALVLLALVLGIVGFPWHSAEATDSCSSFAGCELCLCHLEACMAGQERPQCGGDYYCCNSYLYSCWNNCVWH